MNILVVNAGSSSLKLSLLDGETRKWHANAEAVTDQGEAFARLLKGLPAPDAIGHRLVHGGVEHVGPARVDAALLDDLRRLIPLAPLHLPAELALIEAAQAAYPNVPQVACFDTAFHRRLPPRAEHLPLPAEFYDAGVRRFGFHGLSYEFIVDKLGSELAPRTILAHLGSGASMVALENGVPIDTTMGLTPAGGFMMGTRTGDLDPGVLVHLQRTRGMDADALEELCARKSGLLGVSGLSADLRTLLAQRATHAGAALAIEMFVYQIRKTIGALAAALGGLDLLVFTGGIGEHSADVRGEACARLSHLGIVVDGERNSANAPVISSGPCVVRVLATDEEAMIARHTAYFLSVRT